MADSDSSIEDKNVPSGADSPALLLEMRGIQKSFSGIEVLHGVDITLSRGEVLALLGENGAGKSTLIKILNGDYIKESGDIFIDGQRVELKTPRDAEHAGVSMIYQELNYAPDLSVAENVLLGHLPCRPGTFLVDWKEVYRRTHEVLAMLNVQVDPRQRMRSLSVGRQQTVEIARALSRNARIVVMDEPTAALTSYETDRLFETILALQQRGVAVIYISHRLDEVQRVAQRVTVLRDGSVVGTVKTADVHPRDIVRMMIGYDLSSMYPSRRTIQGKELLTVSHLSRPGTFQDTSFSVREGEIVGLFGLLGAGQSEVMKAIFGAEPAHSGTITMQGKLLSIAKPSDAKRAAMGFVSDDRKVDGLFLDMSVAENLTITNWKKLFPQGLIHANIIRQRAAHWISRLKIRAGAGAQQPVRTLSGGNQQKIVLARWLEVGCRLLLLNEPTRGVDVGARADIYALLEALREEGLGLLLVSSDMEEVLEISNRILVFAKGSLVAELDPTKISKEELLVAAAGGQQ